MSAKRPPRLAALLLERLSDNGPLAGDLEEEYRGGRSTAWYWRQVIVAVCAGPMRGFDLHELFAVQGRFMQCVMLTLISVSAVFTVKLITVYVGEEPVLRTFIGPRGVRELLRIALSFAIAIPTGVAIARVHARSRRAAVLAFSITLALWAFANLSVLNGHGNFDSALPHVVAMLVFVAGLLEGGVHVDALLHSRPIRSTD